MSKHAFHERILDRAVFAFVPRVMLGLMYLYAGVHRFWAYSREGREWTLLDVGLADFVRSTIASRASEVLPVTVVWIGAVATPFVELTLGTLLCLGLWTRPALRGVSVLLVGIAVAYGIEGLMHPHSVVTVMDVSVVNLYLLPRAVLTLAVLVSPREYDRFGLDDLFRRRDISKGIVRNGTARL